MTPAVVRSLLALSVLAGGLVTVASPATLRELSEDERRRLNAGEVIVDDTLPPGASESARGGTALALVRASPEQVWRVLVDYPGHGLFRENSGYWQVDAADAASLVTAIAVRTLLPAFVTRGAERESLTETVTAMRKLVEEGDGAAPRPK